jgi:hypothetical protein
MKALMNMEERCVEKEWNSVWKAQVPPKVCNLIWRICVCPIHCETCED